MTTTSSHSLFALTRKIVEETEFRVMDINPKYIFFNRIARNGIFAFPFIHLGIAELLRPMLKWALITIVLLVGGIAFSKTNVSTYSANSIFILCTFTALFIVVFAVPSTFAFDTITVPQIEELADYIRKQGIDTEQKADSLGECILLVAERTYARTKTLQRLVAVIWGLFLYGLNQFTSITIKLAPDEIAKIFSENIPSVFVYLLVSTLSLGLIVGYKKANDAVFRRLSFAVKELKFRIALNWSVQPIIPPDAAR